jgi:HlyD family secretion protein
MKSLVKTFGAVLLMSVMGLMSLSLISCTKAPVVNVINPKKGSVETTVTTINSGTVFAEQQAILNFGSMGRINEVYIAAGSKVKKGQRLATLENADLRASAASSAVELKRVRDLFAAGLVSQAAVDDADRAAETARAALDRSVVLAPFDGLITEVNLRKGEIAQVPSAPDKPPIRIVDLKARLIKGQVDELDLGKIKLGLTARIKIPALGNRRLTAKLTSTVPFVSSTREQDRTSEIEMRLDEDDPHIPVGASAEVEILIESKDSALTVPSRAILGTAKQRYVYKVVDGHLKRTDVEVGIGNYDRREIIGGLTEGDQIALPSESYEMKDEQKVRVEQQKWL